MPQPYSETLDAEWAKTQNYTDVFWGDKIFDVTQLGAKKLEASWEKIANPWNTLIDKSVQTGFLGWGAPIVDRRWLSFKLFGLEKFWPKGLTKKERLLLRLAKAVSFYYPLFEQGVITDRKWGLTQDPEKTEPEEATLAAMKSYAAKFEAKIAGPMWTSFDKISDEMAPLVSEACREVYAEPCDFQEARGMFQGDLDRAWKIETLGVSHITYKVYGLFNDYIMLSSGASAKGKG